MPEHSPESYDTELGHVLDAQGNPIPWEELIQLQAQEHEETEPYALHLSSDELATLPPQEQEEWAKVALMADGFTHEEWQK